jgi:glycosyltransferase involved in cell wall biosynthesis
MIFDNGMSGEQFKVAIDVTIDPATAGGVAQVALGLVHGLGALSDGNDEYLLVVQSDAEAEYFKPFIGPNQRFAKRPPRRLARRVGARLQQTRNRISHKPEQMFVPYYSISDGFYESLGCEVIHFPHQRFVVCGLPSVYNPHDVQHLHFPQFFTPYELIERDTVYQAGCHYAQAVAASSQWVKDDLVRHYRIVPDKVQVIPWGPPSQPFAEPSKQDVARARAQHNLREPFLLYPAMTWPHKNHIRLLEALAKLRDEHGLGLRLVCTGSHLEPYWSAIQHRIAELNLARQVYFTGFITQVELRAIYRMAQFLVVPTLFESDSSPIYEAWLEGLPVACSNVTSLPAQTLNAARLFDPYDVTAIAQAVREMATEERLRRDLRFAGFERLKDYQWERTAKAYRALYRRTAHRFLSTEDRWLLNWDWMTEPRKTTEASI